jgi:hypothetical protein
MIIRTKITDLLIKIGVLHQICVVILPEFDEKPQKKPHALTIKKLRFGNYLGDFSSKKLRLQKITCNMSNFAKIILVQPLIKMDHFIHRLI